MSVVEKGEDGEALLYWERDNLEILFPLTWSVSSLTFRVLEPPMEFGLLSEAEARSPALSLSDAGTPHPPLPEHGCKGQEHSGERVPFWGWGT